MISVVFHLDSTAWHLSPVAGFLPSVWPAEGGSNLPGLPACGQLQASLYPLCHAPTLSGALMQEASLSMLPQRLLSPWLSPDYSVLEGSICAQSGVHRTTGMLAHAEVNDPKGGAEPNRTRISSYLFFHCGRK